MQNIPAADIAQKLRDDFQRVGLTANLEPIPYSEELTRQRAANFEADLHFFGVYYPGWTDYLPLFAPGGGVAAKRNAYTADVSPESARPRPHCSDEMEHRLWLPISILTQPR